MRPGALLPTGQVLATSGADRDEVASPGTEIPHPTAEIFEPSTKRWRPVAAAKRLRTYHNAATLLPDARVLVGGARDHLEHLPAEPDHPRGTERARGASRAYIVFANRREDGCLIPSVSRQVSIARNGKVAAAQRRVRRQPRFTG